MKMKEKTHVDLTHVDGTFTSVVESNARTLANLVRDNDVTLDEFKDFVFDMLDSCKETKWIRNARHRVEDINDKDDLAFYVYNSMLSGANLAVAR